MKKTTTETKGETPEHRSSVMRAVGSKATSDELAVRAALRPLGLRMRYNAPYLPGKPDIAIHALRLVIFVHGCFWHGHACKRGARIPRTNTAYWTAKIARNRVRDRQSAAALRRAGWKVVTLWACDSERSRSRKLKTVREAAARLASGHYMDLLSQRTRIREAPGQRP